MTCTAVVCDPTGVTVESKWVVRLALRFSVRTEIKWMVEAGMKRTSWRVMLQPFTIRRFISPMPTAYTVAPPSPLTGYLEIGRSVLKSD